MFPQFSRPEFVLLAREAPVTLHLPGSIVVTAGLHWAGVEGGEGTAQLSRPRGRLSSDWVLRLGGPWGRSFSPLQTPARALCWVTCRSHPSALPCAFKRNPL